MEEEQNQQPQQPAPQTEKPKKKFYKKWWFWILVVIVFLITAWYVASLIIEKELSYNCDEASFGSDLFGSSPNITLIEEKENVFIYSYEDYNFETGVVYDTSKDFSFGDIVHTNASQFRISFSYTEGNNSTVDSTALTSIINESEYVEVIGHGITKSESVVCGGCGCQPTGAVFFDVAVPQDMINNNFSDTLKLKFNFLGTEYSRYYNILPTLWTSLSVSGDAVALVNDNTDHYLAPNEKATITAELRGYDGVPARGVDLTLVDPGEENSAAEVLVPFVESDDGIYTMTVTLENIGLVRAQIKSSNYTFHPQYNNHYLHYIEALENEQIELSGNEAFALNNFFNDDGRYYFYVRTPLIKVYLDEFSNGSMGEINRTAITGHGFYVNGDETIIADIDPGRNFFVIFSPTAKGQEAGIERARFELPNSWEDHLVTFGFSDDNRTFVLKGTNEIFLVDSFTGEILQTIPYSGRPISSLGPISNYYYIVFDNEIISLNTDSGVITNISTIDGSKKVTQEFGNGGKSVYTITNKFDDAAIGYLSNELKVATLSIRGSADQFLEIYDVTNKEMIHSKKLMDIEGMENAYVEEIFIENNRVVFIITNKKSSEFSKVQIYNYLNEQVESIYQLIGSSGSFYLAGSHLLQFEGGWSQGVDIIKYTLPKN